MKKCGIKAESIAEQLEVHRGTVFCWISQIKLQGIQEFKRRYRNSKKGKRKRSIDPKLKRLILKIREDFKHYKKNEQAFIERFNCTLRKEC